MQEYQGKVAIITGAASGIGKGCVKAFAEEGARVVALDLNLEGAEKVASELRASGCDVKAVAADITDEKQVQDAFEKVQRDYGALDVLVNSAGIITFEKFPDHTDALWDKVMNVNLRGTYNCCRFAAIIMRAQKSGAIVNISAGAAKTGGMNPSPAYIASKGGMNSLTFHFAVQLSKDGVRVNCICPGPIDTPMIDKQADLPGAKGNGKESIIASVPLGLGYPSDIAEGALFLASSKRARYITGEVLDINGGLIMD